MAYIDIGNSVVNGGGYLNPNFTFIDLNNPANGNGTIVKVKIDAEQILSNVEVGIFYLVSGTSYTTRDTQTIGTVGAGITYHIVNLTVQTGDVIGIFFTAGTVDASAGLGVTKARSASGDRIPCTNISFPNIIERYIGIYGQSAITIPTVTTQEVSGIGSVSATGNGTITATGDENADIRGICWNTGGNPTVANSKSYQTGSFGTGSFSRSMTGLSPGVLYYVRAYAHNSAGYSYGSQVSFTTNKTIPTVTTQACTNVTGNSALGNGTITALGGENATIRGFCYMVGTSGDPTTANSKVYDSGSFGTGAFNKSITGITPGTGYRVRAYAINSIGTGYGTTVQLTADNPPTVTTQAVTAILSTTATGNGNITVLGGETPTKRGICWNLTGMPTIEDEKSEQTGSFGTGTFTRPITGLIPGTLYYVRAYASSSVGYGYGSEVDFTTDKVAPTVTTQDATEIGQNQVKGNGNITVSGGEDATERGFQYGLTQTPTWTKKETAGGYGTGAFNLVIDGLQVNTQYWYRAYAVNSIGTGYGEWVQFQTAASGTIPTGALLNICSDYSGCTYQLHGAETDDGATYESYFVLSTDLADKQGLHFNKRLEDLFSYFKKKESGTCKIYIKCDNEAEWEYAGEVSMTGDEDIIIKHLPSDNEDTTGDVDFLAKHFLIKFVFECDFDFVGLISEFIPEGER